MAVKHFGTVEKGKGTKLNRICPPGQNFGQIGIESCDPISYKVMEGHLYPELRKKATKKRVTRIELSV